MNLNPHKDCHPRAGRGLKVVKIPAFAGMTTLWFYTVLGLTLALSSCGLQRNLELPGHEKYVHRDDQDNPAADDDDSDNTPITSQGNPTVPKPMPPAGVTR